MPRIVNRFSRKHEQSGWDNGSDSQESRAFQCQEQLKNKRHQLLWFSWKKAPAWASAGRVYFYTTSLNSLGSCKWIGQAESHHELLLGWWAISQKRWRAWLLNILCSICYHQQKEKGHRWLCFSLLLPFLTSHSLLLLSHVSRILPSSLSVYLFIGSFSPFIKTAIYDKHLLSTCFVLDLTETSKRHFLPGRNPGPFDEDRETTDKCCHRGRQQRCAHEGQMESRRGLLIRKGLHYVSKFEETLRGKRILGTQIGCKVHEVRTSAGEF